MTTPDVPYLTLAEAASLLKRHPATLKRWIARGWLPEPVIVLGKPVVHRDQVRVPPEAGQGKRGGRPRKKPA